MYCRPVKDLQLGVFRISDVREYPGVSYESSSTVVACMMATDMESPEKVVLKLTRERGLKECACGALIVQELLFKCPMCLGRKCVRWSVRVRYFGTREGLERVNWRCVMTLSG